MDSSLDPVVTQLETGGNSGSLPTNEASGDAGEFFNNIKLKPELLRGVHDYGLSQPSLPQQQAMLAIIHGDNVIIQSQSGTGKTIAAFVSILQKVNTAIKDTQALILVPTRELARNLRQVLHTLGCYTRIECHVCLSAVTVCDDVARLREGVHVVLGTPGRIYDMILRRALKTTSIQTVCLDKVDEMVDRGFKEQIRDVIQNIPQGTQLVSLSSTMPTVAIELCRDIMKDPLHIHIQQGEGVVKGVNHFYVVIDEEWKLETLHDLYQLLGIPSKVAIFCNTSERVSLVADKMTSQDFSVKFLRIEFKPVQRNATVEELYSGSSRVWVAIDPLCYNMDLQRAVLVINYDFPKSCKNYASRVGGGNDIVINFVSSEDMKVLREIESFYGIQIGEMPLNLFDSDETN